MDKIRIRKIAQYVGIGAALSVPALVVGQEINPLRNLNLGDGALLRGQDVRLLRDDLVTAIGRINALESQLNEQGAGISKANLVLPVPESLVAIPPGARQTASVSCPDVNDIAIDCHCGGDTGPGTSGSSFVDLRIIQTVNQIGSASRCDCVGENVGTNANQRIIARVLCLRP